MIKTQILQALQNILQDMGASDIMPQLDIPSDLDHGDYTTSVAFQLSKVLKKSPLHIAQEITAKLTEKPIAGVKNVEAVAPGFINFWITNEELINNMQQVIKEDGKVYDAIKTRHPQTIIVEYSSPNIAKPFTVGHLRSTIIGDAVANLLEAVGNTVKRDNHVGDWGTQFGKQIYAIKNIRLPYITYSEGEDIGNINEQAIENSDRPVTLLVDLYVQFHTEAKDHPEMEDKARGWFKKLEDGDTEARRLWQKCIDWSWKEFNAIYQELGVTFTENGGKGFGESFVEDKMAAVIAELEEKHILQDSEGAKVVFFPEEKYPPLLIIKKDGATLYATRDLAIDKYRLDTYGKDIIIINEVGAEQSLYFQQLYEIEQMLGWFSPKQRVHIKHGMYRFKDGKMSTRKGNVIWLEDVLKEAENKVYLSMKKRDIKKEIPMANFLPLIKEIATGALKWNDLKHNSRLDIVFNWDELTSVEGNSGPYIQYTYARTQSILRKSSLVIPTEVEGSHTTSSTNDHQRRDMRFLDSARNDSATDEALLYNKVHYEIEEYGLIRDIYHFPEIVQKAAATYSPNVICEYLFRLAQAFNLFYQKYRILDADKEDEKKFRLALTRSVGDVIKEGLRLLGIAAPSEM